MCNINLDLIGKPVRPEIAAIPRSVQFDILISLNNGKSSMKFERLLTRPNTPSLGYIVFPQSNLVIELNKYKDHIHLSQWGLPGGLLISSWYVLHFMTLI